MTTELDAAPLANLPTTRRAILTAIKRSGPITTAVLAHQLGITVTAVRQQLHRLGEDGLVVPHPDPAGRGRARLTRGSPAGSRLALTRSS